jgi:hypothetical protein
MFGDPPRSRDERCACGRPPEEATVATYRSISGTYRFHRCPCGIAWTEHHPDPEQPAPTPSRALREFHEHCQALADRAPPHTSAARR